MILCDFVRSADSIRCRRCGYSRRWTRADQLPRRSCGAKPAAGESPPRKPAARCLHLGDKLRDVQRKTCRGLVLLPVHVCAKYGEATVERRGPDVPGCCKGCALFEPPPS